MYYHFFDLYIHNSFSAFILNNFVCMSSMLIFITKSSNSCVNRIHYIKVINLCSIAKAPVQSGKKPNCHQLLFNWPPSNNLQAKLSVIYFKSNLFSVIPENVKMNILVLNDELSVKGSNFLLLWTKVFLTIEHTYISKFSKKE